MNKNSMAIIAAMTLVPLYSSFALDKACQPVLAGMEYLTQQKAIHVNTVTSSGDVKTIIVNGYKYMSVEEDVWEKLDVTDPNETYATILAEMKSEELKLSACKSLGDEVVNGVATKVTSYQIDMELAPEMVIPAKMTVYIGKEDGLPYKESQSITMGPSEMTSITIYRYTDVAEPKIN